MSYREKAIFLLGAFGSALNVLIIPFIATHTPALAKTEPPALGIFFMVESLLEVVGGILLGIATMRASILPRWAGLLLMVGVSVDHMPLSCGNGNHNWKRCEQQTNDLRWEATQLFQIEWHQKAYCEQGEETEDDTHIDRQEDAVSQ